MKGMKLTVNLFTLGVALAAWTFLFPKSRNKLRGVLETIPAFKEFKKEAFRNVGVEGLKIVGLYILLTQTNKVFR